MERYCSYDNFLLCCSSFVCVLKIYYIELVEHWDTSEKAHCRKSRNRKEIEINIQIK